MLAADETKDGVGLDGEEMPKSRCYPAEKFCRNLVRFSTGRGWGESYWNAGYIEASGNLVALVCSRRCRKWWLKLAEGETARRWVVWMGVRGGRGGD